MCIRDRFTKDEYFQINNNAPLDFSLMIDAFYNNNNRMIKEKGPYFELIWELCTLLPIPYFNGLPINTQALSEVESFSNLTSKEGISFLQAKQLELIDYNFNVCLLYTSRCV